VPEVRTPLRRNPFDWKRLSDDEKVAFLDSVKVQRERMAAANPGQGGQMAQAFGAMMGGGGGGGGGAPQVMMRFEGGGGGGGGAPTRAPQVMAPQITYVSPSQLPDYQPPFWRRG
jgi:hypothetical protein